MKISELTALLFSNSSKFESHESAEVNNFVTKNAIPDEEVPNSIVELMQKMNNNILLTEEDIAILYKEFDTIANFQVHDALTLILNLLRPRLFHSRELQLRLEDARNLIKEHIFNGEQLVKCDDESDKYNSLINLQRIKFIPYKLKMNSFSEDRAASQFDEIRIQATVGVNALFILGKISKKHLLDEENYPPKITQIQNALNSHPSIQGEQLIIFSHINTQFKRYYESTWAMNGNKFARVGTVDRSGYKDNDPHNWFIVSDQIKPPPVSFIVSDQIKPPLIAKYTNKQRSEYHTSDQTRWNAFSEETIKTSAQLLMDAPKYHNLASLLFLLGGKRQIVAQQLGHGPTGLHAGYYGAPRFARSAGETIEKGKGGWKKLYEPLQRRLTANPPPLIDDSSNFLIGAYKFEMIAICYPTINTLEECTNNLNRLQPDFDKLLSWDGKDIDEFIKDIGRLSYSLYRQLPFILGTSAIVNWLVRTVALYKGVELGPEKENELTLDWESFVTHDREAFADWFVEHAYAEVHFNALPAQEVVYVDSQQADTAQASGDFNKQLEKADLDQKKSNVAVCEQDEIGGNSKSDTKLPDDGAALQAKLTKALEIHNKNPGLQPKQKDSIKALQTPEELTCLNYLEKKLIPLTEEYLRHLLAKAQKMNPSIEKNIIYRKLPSFKGNDSDKKNYAVLDTKYSITNKLLTMLTDKKTNPLPSQRVSVFAQALKRYDEQLKQHRDPFWKRFLKASIVVLGVLASTIIPGLIGLFAYSSRYGKSSPLFFVKSHGAEFSDEAKAAIEKTKPSS